MKARTFILTAGAALVLAVPAANAATGANRLHEAQVHTALAEKSEPLLRFDRSDGFTFDDHLLVSANGRSTYRLAHHGRVSSSLEFVLTPGQLMAFQAALKAARWQSLRDRYDSDPECCDQVGYWITYAGRTVVTNEWAVSQKRVPPRLARLLALLNSTLRGKA